MSASPWAYLVGIILALPVFFLVGLLLLLIGRLTLEWLLGDGSAPTVRVKLPGKGNRSLEA